jgi:hypothetical protein
MVCCGDQNEGMVTHWRRVMTGMAGLIGATSGVRLFSGHWMGQGKPGFTLPVRAHQTMP